MKYETYENRFDRHVMIHRDSCSQLRKHGGEHRYGQGEHRKFTSFVDARVYAETTGLGKK